MQRTAGAALALKRTKEGGKEWSREAEREELPTEKQSGSGANLVKREPLEGRTGRAAG